MVLTNNTVQTFKTMKGLNNLGNTCYFNSCLQCLLHTPALSNYFIRYPYTGDCEFTREYSNIVKQFWTPGEKLLDTKNILKIFKNFCKDFDNSDEHDSQECLLSIIDILHKGTKNIRLSHTNDPSNEIWDKKSNSLIKPLFYGQVEKTVVYPEGKSKTFENFSNFLLFPSKNEMTLGQIIKDYFKDVVLSDYVDDNGKVHSCSVLQTSTTRVPPICVFCFNMYIRKVRVTIPEQIIINGVKYKLFALCEHMGTMMGGHYRAFVHVGGKWWLKDDDVSIEKKPNLTNCFYFCMFKEIRQS